MERIAYAREPQKLPVVLSADEVVRFLEAMPGLKSRTALTTVYAAGLRVSEAVMLKIADIDSGRMAIRVEQGKGGKDRYVMLSPQLDAMQVRAAERLANEARKAGVEYFVHISGIGADAQSPSPYIRARGQGEQAVRGVFGAATVRSDQP